jgi:hypothetical protein
VPAEGVVAVGAQAGEDLGRDHLPPTLPAPVVLALPPRRQGRAGATPSIAELGEGPRRQLRCGD